MSETGALPPARGRIRRCALALFGVTLVLSHAHAQSPPSAADAGPGAALVQPDAPASGAAPLDEALLLALDPERLSAAEVSDVLARAPAPTVISLQGSLPSLSMQSFGEFLIAMGYPEARLRDPVTGKLSYPSSGDSAALAGIVAWHYEREGMMPILVGHSRGGMLAIRVLHELAGEFHPTIAVRQPGVAADESRVEILDPLSGKSRPVVGLRVGYAAAIATGKLPRILLGQWDMISRLRKIPDTVEEFTGYTIEWDPIAGTFPGSEPYRATGSATVRNVILPPRVSHLGAIALDHLARDAAARAWIERYTPDAANPLPVAATIDTTNILQAADLWYSIRKHWCLEAQRLARARREREHR